MSTPANPRLAATMPLPADVVVHVSWFGRARQFPIFSPVWFRYRSIAFLTGLFAVAVLFAAITALPLQPQDIDWGKLLQVAGVYGMPSVVLVLFGPGLAVLVRRQGWSLPGEVAALLCVLLLGMVASVVSFIQFRDLYQATRVDSASGERTIHMLPQPHLALSWSGGETIPTIGTHSQWRPLSQAERRAQEAVEQARLDILRTAPPQAKNADAPPLTSVEETVMKDYLTVLSENGTLTPAQERATRSGRDAHEKLLRWQVDFAARPHPQIQGSAEYHAASARMQQAIEALARARQQADPAAVAPAPPPPYGGPSAAGIAGASVLLLGISLLACWLGGVTDLVTYVRQRGKLDDVLRDQALHRADAARAAAELRMSVLAAQVEPHFLFNTLASVRSAIVSDQARAAAIVDHLVDYLRSTIPQMRDEAASTSVPLGHQLDAARAYLSLMHERMPRLAFSVDAEPGLEKAQVPPLMLISLVENAVKHGVEPKSGPASIAVSARRQEHAGVAMLELHVVDDGTGFGCAMSGTGIGLANIQERLAAQYGAQAGLTLKSLPEGGVAAILRLPLSFLRKP